VFKPADLVPGSAWALAEIVEGLRKRLDNLVVGDARHPDTQIGPVVDEQQLHTDLEYIDIGRSEGAELAYGGSVVERPTSGYYLGPALFIGPREQGRYAAEFYTIVKTAYTAAG
jgi:acyl-CoA reductase-like NAD-dependent aldehyde dehydrogenase